MCVFLTPFYGRERVGGRTLELTQTSPRLQYHEMSSAGPTHFKIPIRAREEFGAPWLLNHRVDLHAELLRLATREDDLTAPAVVRTASRVERIVSLARST